MVPRVPTLFAAIALLGAAACSSTPPKPVGRVEVPVQPEAERVQVKAGLSSEIVIHLPSIEKPGEQWTIIQNDGRFLHQLGPIKPTPEGGATVSFHAVRQGRKPLRFLTLPASYREATPSQRYDLTIEIE